MNEELFWKPYLAPFRNERATENGPDAKESLRYLLPAGSQGLPFVRRWICDLGDQRTWFRKA
jgi:hypothetical protein